MGEFLRFRLHGPLASWGETPGASIRATALHPTRSALLGLVAAALGLDRQDDAAHVELGRALRFAVRVDALGVPLVDYHTAQVLVPKRGRRPPESRADQVAAPRHQLATTVSVRHYRADAAYTVVAWVEGDPGRFSLDTLRAALVQPHFVLSLGRKSCPLAWPLAPRIIVAETAAAVFRNDPDAALFDEFFPRWRRRFGGFYWEGDEALVGLTERERHERRDVPTSRRRQTYTRRFESYSPELPEEVSDVSQSP